MSDEMVLHKGQSLSITTIDDVTTIADLFVASGMFPDLKSQASAAVRIMAGQELGIGPFASISNIIQIKGKLAFSSNLMAQRVKNSGRYDYRVRIWDEKVCKIEFFQDGESLGISDFSIAKAQRAGLLGNPAWRSYPEALLFARTLSQGVRTFCPDVMGGHTAYVPEELGALSDEPEPARNSPKRTTRRVEPDVTVEAPVVEATVLPDAEPPSSAPEADPETGVIVETSEEAEALPVVVQDDPFAEDAPIPARSWSPPQGLNAKKEYALALRNQRVQADPTYKLRRIVNDVCPAFAGIQLNALTDDQWHTVLLKDHEAHAGTEGS